MKVVTKQDIKNMISSGKLIKVQMQNHHPIGGDYPKLSPSMYPITLEYNLLDYLIKVDNHYVSAKYLFYEDSGEERTNYIEDKNASLPRIVFHNDSGKWIVAFDSPDIGGYDVQEFEWYFDSVEDIIKEMEG